MFQHWLILKLIWNSPNGRERNQIGHSIDNGKCRRSLIDVTMCRGAGVGSDHHLVITQLKVKLRSTYKKLTLKHFDIDKFKDEKLKNIFVIEPRNQNIYKQQNLPKSINYGKYEQDIQGYQ